MKALLCNVVLGVSLALTPALSVFAQSPPGTCSAESFTSFEKALIAAQAAFQSGNPEPLKALWSHADDVTLMGAYGGHERGWALIGARLSRIGGMKTTSRHDNDEVVSRIVGSNLAMIVQLEHIVNPGAPTDNLRVTHVARCEGSEWRIVHRHADPLMETKMPPMSASRSAAEGFTR